jgi:hypothetical protein
MRGDDQLSYSQVTEFLVRLGDFPDIVLVGGQAVSCWAEHYLSLCRAAELEAGAPYTSKDADFFGDRKAASRCAQKLNGRAQFPDDPGDPSPSSAKVVFKDANGQERTIDFLRVVYGLDSDDLVKTSIAFVVHRDDKPTGLRIRVMHPERCMESRAHNFVGLPGYRGEHSLKQLRASIVCCREFIRDLIDAGKPRAALDVMERVFDFCTRDIHGRVVQAESDLDPFEAVFVDARLPEKFATERYQRMVTELEATRGRLAVKPNAKA